jgi:hypothetical protein
MSIAGQSIYNLNIGTYDVSVAAGPSYTTKRQEAAEGMMQLVQSAPETMQFAGDIITRNMDWPGADDLAERYKMMLPPPVQQALQAKEQGQDPKIEAAMAPLKQALDQTQQQAQQMQQALQEQGEALKRIEMENAALKAQKDIDARKADTDQYKAETERMALAPELTPEAIQLVVAQTVQEITSLPAPEEPEPPPLEQMQPNQAPPGAFLSPEGLQ